MELAKKTTRNHPLHPERGRHGPRTARRLGTLPGLLQASDRFFGVDVRSDWFQAL